VKGDSGVLESLNAAAASAAQNIVMPKQSPQDKIQQSLQDKQDLAKTRNELHSIYYQNLVNPKKQVEESVVEKLEREDKQKEFEELETKSKKPKDLPQNVKLGTGEKVVGVSG
jgi:hypothetical protein